MKLIFAFFLLSFSFNSFSQDVIASGQNPAWILDYDQISQFHLYIGEEASTYSLVKETVPEGSMSEISKTYLFQNQNGKMAVLVIEYFDPESPESCPCFHDGSDGNNAGKAYLITENQRSLIGCAEFTGDEILSAMD